MTAYTIDTLAAVRKLEQAGFDTGQAEAMTEVIAESGEQLATKGDIAGVKDDIVGLRWTFGILFGFLLTLNLTMFGFLFAVWRDVASLTAG